MSDWDSGGALQATGGTAPDTSDQDGIGALLGGEGSAVGDNTLSTGDAALEMVDYGPLTVVWGTTAVFSTAASPDGEDAFAYADTYGSVPGADLVFTFSADLSGAGSGRGGTSETAISTTHLVAVEIEDFDFPGGPRMFEVDTNGRIHGFFFPASGNRSAASAQADAEGDSTYTLAFADSETTNDSSSVTMGTYGLIA